MESKIQTIEDLAVLIQSTMASKEDIKELRQDMDERFEKVDDNFTEVFRRLDKIEDVL